MGQDGSTVRRGDADVDDRKPGVVRGRSPKRGKCTYRRGGVCVEHGPGAKLCWIPMKVPNPAPGEKKTTRHYYYSCDVGPRGKVLRQTRLSFGAVRKEDNPRRQEDSTNGDFENTPTAGK